MTNDDTTTETVRIRSSLHPFTLSPFHPFIVFGLFLLALLPRVVGLADFFTTDEAYHWVERVERFSDALARGEWDKTNQTGHPGVTAMWLGSGGLALERLVVARGWSAAPTPVEHLAWLRLPHALLEALLVPLAFLLLRRLVAPATALIAATLWATSPYLIAHARLLHLDALLTAFVTLSVLLLLVGMQNAKGKMQKNHIFASFFIPHFAFCISGVFAGLALLTKGPALILLPIVGLIMLARVTSDELRVTNGAASFISSFSRSLARSLMLFTVWLGVALLVVALLWPALWANPARALHSYTEEITANGGRPNGDGQFFFGRAVDDPGWLFYPVANAFRMTPAVTVGLLLLVGFTIYNLRFTIAATEDERRTTKDERRTLLALGVFIAIWTLVMTVGPKKFDRYVLPTWPAIVILAAAGWNKMYDWRLTIGDYLHKRRSRLFSILNSQFSILVLCCLFFVLEAAQPYFVHPYYLSYYNPLLGGGAAAQRVLLIGWGEGMDRVGATIRARPDGDQGPVVSALAETLRPFVPVPVRDVDEIAKANANYAVVYRESLQRNANPPLYARIQETVPVATVTLHGIDYAQIHQLSKPFARPVDARYGDWLRLRGVTVARSAGRLIVTPSWDVRARPPADYLLFLHLLDERGSKLAQVDVAPGGDRPTRAWHPGEQLAVPLTLALPTDVSPGTYQLVLGLYDPTSGARLLFSGATVADASIAGPNAVLLDTLRLP